MPADVKKVIKSLLLEQGHLCAYCMSRINADDGKHKTTIEHCTPQSATTEKSVWIIKIWSQICWGNPMHIPMMTKAVMQKRHFERCTAEYEEDQCSGWSILSDIKYRSDGTIYSDNMEVDEDLNVRF